MPAYAYRAVDANQRVTTGRIRASDESAVNARLAQRGLRVTWLELAVKPPTTSQLVRRSLFPVGARVHAALFRRLQDLFEAGFTPHDAVDRVQLGAGHSRLKEALREMAPQLAEGAALSDVMEDYPNLFRPHVIGLVRTGERAGALPAMMGEIAGHFEREDRIWRSLRWPLGILVATILPAPLLIIAFRFIQYLGDNMVRDQMGLWDGVARALVQFFMREGLVAIILSILMVVGLIAAQILLHYPGLRQQRDAIALRLPVFGKYTRISATARLLRTVMVAHHAGAHFDDALSLGCDAAVNAEVADRVRPQVPLVREGKRLAVALDDTGLFPDTTVGVLATAEDTGKLSEALARAVEDIEDERNQQVKVILTHYWLHAIIWVVLVSCGALALMLGGWYGGMIGMVDGWFAD